MGSPRWLNDEERRAWLSFLAAASLLDRHLDQQLHRDAGLSHLQYVILARLSDAPDREMQMGELSAALLEPRPKLTYHVDQLVRKTLVVRRTCPGDRRSVYAVLTDAGQRALERAAPGHVADVRESFIDVLTREQITAVADGLGEIARRLRDRG
ncbi:MarR family transcriptional regulator [Nocardia vinacea]|uniref:MarR family winged helix-turn-helix transcriptional regulator n=1 Tax=Nocardia vinacea TaxID=96468 RepID=UPI00341CC6A7